VPGEAISRLLVTPTLAGIDATAKGQITQDATKSLHDVGHQIANNNACRLWKSRRPMCLSNPTGLGSAQLVPRVPSKRDHPPALCSLTHGAGDFFCYP
jgi:hypothetical protein